MIRNRYIGIYLGSAFMAGTLFLSSCSQDEEISSVADNVTTSEFVTFGIDLPYRWAPDVIEGTKDASNHQGSNQSRTASLPMECIGGDISDTEIYMYMVEEDYPAVKDTLSVDSRNSDATSSATTPDIGIYAFHHLEGETTTFMNNISLSAYGNDSYWPGTGSLDFYAYYPHMQGNQSLVPGLTMNVENNKPKFTYQVPTEISQQYGDLMLGSISVPGNHLNNVEFGVNHLLSKVQLKAGTMKEGVVKSVSFKNIYHTGSLEFDADTWTVKKDLAEGEEGSLLADYTQDFSTLGEKNGIDLATIQNGTPIGDPMYLMPQNLKYAKGAADNAKIEIVLDVNYASAKDGKTAETYTLTKDLADFQSIWSRDKVYTYVISTPEEVEVEVSDVVEGYVKKDLVIRNTGLATAYIRASIVGNWVIPAGEEPSDEDIIVADWIPEEHGTFNWGADNGNKEPSEHATTGWYKHPSDGYYYYLNPVARGCAVPDKLFETYTLNPEKVPVSGAVLDLSIVVQAVLDVDVAVAWPSDVLQSKYRRAILLNE